MERGLLVPVLVGSSAVVTAFFAWLVYKWKKEREEALAAAEEYPYQRVLPPGLRMVFGSGFFLLTVPFFVDNWGRWTSVIREEPSLGFVFLFAGVGFGMIVSGCIAFIRG